jgi:hypothetical protein
MADFVSSILLQFKTDTRLAKAQIKDLADEQKKLAQSSLAATERQNLGLEAQVAKWGKIAGAVGIAVGAVQLASHAVDEYGRHSRLVAAAGEADFKRIQAASHGLLTETEALKIAAAGTNGVMRLSQREMEAVAKASVVLRNRGHDLSEVHQELTKAITEGSVEGLKKFGISLEGLKPGQERHIGLMTALSEINAEAGDNIERAGDKSAQAKTKWRDALNELVVALGRIADALAPIVGALADVTSFATTIFESLNASAVGWLMEYMNRPDAPDGGAAPRFAGRGIVDQAGQYHPYTQAQADAARAGLGFWGRSMLGAGPGSAGIAAGVGQWASAFAGTYGFLAPSGKPEVWKSPALLKAEKEAKEHAEWLARQHQYVGGGGAFQRARGWAPYLGLGERAGSRGRGTSSIYGAYDFDGRLPGQLGAGGIQLGELGAVGFSPFAQGLARGGGSADPLARLGQRFDLNAQQIVAQSRLATEALSGLQTVGTEVFTALITGSESFGKAFKQAIGGVLVGMSTQLAGEAIKEGVLALVALAKFNPAGVAEAALHGKAAAAAAAGAIAIGALARGMGAGQGGGGGRSAGTGAPAGAARSFSPGAGADGTRTTVVFVGNSDNPRRVRKEIYDQLERATSEHGRSTAVRRE